MSTMRIGHGFDVHALGKGLRLRMGGTDIPHTKGCIAHSDGDVLIHAICDALLGAATLGDIGLHFPDTSDQFKDIDSTILLKQTVDMLHSRGYRIVNIDASIQAQAPKLMPYIETMRKAVAVAAGIEIDQISIKATTTEKLGFVGREEGIAVDAVTLIEKH